MRVDFLEYTNLYRKGFWINLNRNVTFIFIHDTRPHWRITLYIKKRSTWINLYQYQKYYTYTIYSLSVWCHCSLRWQGSLSLLPQMPLVGSYCRFRFVSKRKERSQTALAHISKQLNIGDDSLWYVYITICVPRVVLLLMV